ncbi:hypothetical protein ACOZ4N_15980 [Halorientalis pallida]|uniref:hypothetical protein n=1 Tax=Halorientalis pallida TaxID=2479928 RepID=UPI003C6FFADE
MAPHTGVSRRTVLAGLGSAGLLAATGTAVGQAQSEGITTRAAVPEAEEYDTASLAGFFVHVDTDPDPIQAPLAEECGYADWPRDETMAYEVLLIDRKDTDHFATETRVYVPDDRSIPSGGLFVINEVEQCPGSYVGVELEQIAADASVLDDVTPGGDAAADPGATGTTAADGPGLGVLTALSGLAGAGALARWVDGDE